MAELNKNSTPGQREIQEEWGSPLYVGEDHLFLRKSYINVVFAYIQWRSPHGNADAEVQELCDGEYYLFSDFYRKFYIKERFL